MASDTNVNALMQFVLGEVPIAGESQSTVDPTDSLATQGSTTWTQNFYFEIKDFDFSLELDERSGVDGSDQGGGGGGSPDEQIDKLRRRVKALEDSHSEMSAVSKATGENKPKATSAGQGGRFEGYVSGSQEPAGYKARVAPFSFKKQIDLATTPLITHCFKRTKFDSATIIKRKDIGGGSTVSNLTYVRFDFLEPLITGVELSVDDVVQQTVKFVCRQVTITYAAQQASGQTTVQTNAAVMKLNG